MNGGNKPAAGSKEKKAYQDGVKKSGGNQDEKVTDDTMTSTETPAQRGGLASDDAPKK